VSEALVDQLEVRLLHPLARAPERARAGDAGYDLRCVEGFSLAPGQRATVGTGVAIALPAGVAALVVPRSGLASRCGLSVVNGPGLIDPGYRGEVIVILLNTDAREPFAIERGERIAQLLIARGEDAVLVPVDGELDATVRGAGGLGSTGR